MLTVNTIVQVSMILSISLHFLYRAVFPRTIRPDPERSETMAWVLPCYNESPEEMTRSLDSLSRQVNLENHKKVILIICDGRAKGRGMEKSCADSLLEDILPCDNGRKYKNAYIARDALDVSSALTSPNGR